MWNRILQDATQRQNYSQLLAKRNAEIGAFLTMTDQSAWPAAVNDRTDNLSGIPLAVKDNIAVLGQPLTCGSKMLADFTSPYNATAVDRLHSAGAWVLGKTNLDEFGMGSSTENSALGTTNNPWDTNRVAGGSSGGSAAAVAAGMVPAALGSDTGGSIRQPAAFCGVYGLKPTYGVVSRYGLVAYASSLEVIGVLAESIDALRSVFATISGSDPYDQTSVDAVSWDADSRSAGKRSAGENGAAQSGVASNHSPDPRVAAPIQTIGVLTGDLALDPAVERNYRSFLEALEDLGLKTKPIDFSLQEYVSPAYYTIAMAEASANLARYNGVRYGHRPVFSENPEELVRKARSEALGPEVKLRIVTGTYVLRSGFQDQYYLRAQKIRTLIRRELDRALSDVDLIVSPVFPTQAFSRGETGMDAFQQKVADRFTVTANLAGLPALTVPSGTENGLPVGMQFMGPAGGEARLFEAARTVSKTFALERPDAYPAPV